MAKQEYRIGLGYDIHRLVEGRELIIGGVKITHEKGFERVEFCVNGQIYKYNEDYQLYDPEQKELEYKFKMIEGRNTVVILAVSIDGTEKIYTGECEYIPEQ